MIPAYSTPRLLAQNLKYVDRNGDHDFFKSPHLSKADLDFIYKLLKMNERQQNQESKNPESLKAAKHIFFILDQFNTLLTSSVSIDGQREAVIREIKQNLDRDTYLPPEIAERILSEGAGFGFFELSVRGSADSPAWLKTQDLYWKGLAKQIECRLPLNLPLGKIKDFVLNHIKEYKEYILYMPVSVSTTENNVFKYLPRETLPPEIKQFCASIRLERMEGVVPSAKRNEDTLVESIQKLKKWKKARDAVIATMVLEDEGVLKPHNELPLNNQSLKLKSRSDISTRFSYTNIFHDYEAILFEASVLPARIKKTDDFGAIKLSLGICCLSSLPKEVGYNFERINLAINQLNQLPEVTYTEKLKWLDVSNNQLTSIPVSISNAPNLEYLLFDYNLVTNLPDSLFFHNRLRHLHLHHNQISEIPDGIGNLTLLQVLHLAHNQINALPESIGNLKNLKTLIISDNQLTSLPESIGDMEKLEVLDLRKNPIKELPKSIVKLRNLKDLYVDEGVVIPEELKEIMRRNNQ